MRADIMYVRLSHSIISRTSRFDLLTGNRAKGEHNGVRYGYTVSLLYGVWRKVNAYVIEYVAEWLLGCN